MKVASLVLCGLVLAALPCTSARADTFSFSFTGQSVFDNAYSGSGYFTATDLGGGMYNVTDVSGTVTGLTKNPSAITGVLPVGTYQGNDNILIYPGTPGIGSPQYFDDSGVAFSLANNRDVDLFDFALVEGAIGGRPNRDGLFELDLVDVSASNTSPVPEPGTLTLLGTGMLAAAGALRRRLMA